MAKFNNLIDMINHKSKEKRVLSLFDGLGGARLALDEANIPVSEYHASEIDKYASAVSKYNYPNINQVGDVTKLNPDDFKDIDLVIGGSPCFVAGTKVICKNEYKNIEDVRIGDYVLTHKNKFEKVLNIGGKKSNTITVTAQGIKPTETTTNHPYYTREMERRYDKKRRTTFRFFNEPIWKNAGELKKGDFIGLPIMNTSENPLDITEEEAFIIGRYIADGHTRKDFRKTENRPNDRHWQVILSIGSHKLDAFKLNIKSLHYSAYIHTKSVHRVVFSNKRLVEIVESNCGCGAKNKKISLMLLNLPNKVLSRLIDGYLSGDGGFRKGVHRAETISEELIMTLNIALAKVYKVNSGYKFLKKNPTHVIEGRIVNQSDGYVTNFRKEMKKQSQAMVDGDIIWLPVRGVEETNNVKQVYNLEVENDNSYTANNAIVHNCQSFSFAGRRNGMSTKDNLEVTTLEQYLELKEQKFEFEGQSYLFWEYVRMLKAIKPKYFLLENVMMVQKWKDIITNTLFEIQYGENWERLNPGDKKNKAKFKNIDTEDIIEWDSIIINSSLTSAQNRKRNYWTNIKGVTQPKDRGLVIKDILDKEATEQAVKNTERNKRHYKEMDQKSLCLTATMYKGAGNNGMSLIPIENSIVHNNGTMKDDEVRIGSLRGRYLEDGKRKDKKDKSIAGKSTQRLEIRSDEKSNCLTTVQKDNLVVVNLKKECIQIGIAEDINGHESIKRVYSEEGKAPTVNTCTGGNREPKVAIVQSGRGFNKGGKHTEKSPTVTSCAWQENNTLEIDNGNIKLYRKLTPLECERLQTIRDLYTLVPFMQGKKEKMMSNSQRYRMIGNGFTISVIAHILSFMD